MTPLAELLSDAQPVKYSRVLEMGAIIQAEETHPYALSLPMRQLENSIEEPFHRVLHPIVSVWWKQTGESSHRLTISISRLTDTTVSDPEAP